MLYQFEGLNLSGDSFVVLSIYSVEVLTSDK